MKHVIVPFMALLAMLCAMDANARCRLTGTVTDRQKDPVVSASLCLFKDSLQQAATFTDFDGHYIFENMSAGVYKLITTYQGKTSEQTIRISARDKVRTFDFVMEGQATVLKSVAVMSKRTWSKPTADYRKPAMVGGVKTAEMLEIAPTTQLQDQYAASPGVYPNSSGTLSIGGGRTSGAVFIVDGAQMAGAAPAQGYLNPSTETYKKEAENDFRSVKASPLSTLSVDVDRASYTNVRRFLNQGQRPPADAVRVEEMINYFDYKYPQPTGSDPIAIQTEVSECPWDKSLKLLRIGIQAKKIDHRKLPASNLVFLLDVSGSMDEANKLPLVKAAMKLLVRELRPQDRVSIVVYAGSAGVVLPSTSGAQKETIVAALDRLEAGGSTAGGAGIELAYNIAQQHFVQGGNNRVILATDGDFNVGVSNDNDLEALIVKKRGKGIFLTCLGFGMGNYKDAKMELMADKGNGNYNYIDNIQEAQKTFVNEFGGTLFTVAKDVKAQIEFNPAKVQGYRLVGYENRLLNTEDFKDDKKDAGDMGSGHTVTMLYELIPAGIESPYMRDNDGLKYQTPAPQTSRYGHELATVKFRYKQPEGMVSKEMVHPIADETVALNRASENTRFAASVAMFGLLLRDSKHKGSASYRDAISLAERARGTDEHGYRSEYIRLVKLARQ